MENRIISILTLMLLVLLGACSSQTPKDQSSIVATDSLNLIQLSSEQMNVAGIITGKIQKHLLSEIVECNGTIEANPKNKALISPPMKGYLKSINTRIGSYVNKGEVLAVLSHPDYIRLQQEYLETKSQYDYYKEDFKRQGELSLEQAASIKKMQEAQNEFRKTEARLFACKHLLSFIGISADSLNVENIKSSINLVSPINGFVSEINGSMGMLCPEEKPVFQVIGRGQSILHLKVYEREAFKISPGQEISFSLLSDPEKSYRALIQSSTHSIDENNAINLHADILDTDNSLMPGMFVKARILVNSDSVYALNSDAVASGNNTSYIFLKTDSTEFRILQVQTGRTMDEMVEILSPPTSLIGSEIVVFGAYYLYAESMSEE